MNQYTEKSQFLESAEYILNNSDLLIKSDCLIYDEVLYERLGAGEWRFFFSIDDYDYVEEEELMSKLESLR